MKYQIYEDKLATKFICKNLKNKELTKQIKEKYKELETDPYSSIDNTFKSKKCPRCKKTRIGNYRLIFFIS